MVTRLRVRLRNDRSIRSSLGERFHLIWLLPHIHVLHVYTKTHIYW